MATSVAELAKAQISRIENLQREWEQARERCVAIEAELAKICGNDYKVAKQKVQGRGRPKKDGENKVNKAAEIRAYYEAHKDARPKDIIAALSEKGIEVSPAAVWQAIHKPPTGKRGRPKSSDKNEPEAKDESSSEGGQGRRPEGERLEDVILKILSRNKNGLKLRDLVQRVIASGYKTKSDQTTLSASVQNCLSKLKEREVVVKDQETRRYSVKSA